MRWLSCSRKFDKTLAIKFASMADRDEAMSTGMTDGMEMSYKALDGVLAEG